MKRSRFSEEQIIGILKEHQAWMSTLSCAEGIVSVMRRFASDARIMAASMCPTPSA